MAGWLRSRSAPPGSHLPPVEVSSLLTVNKKGRVRALQKIETPVDDFNVPNVASLNETIFSSLQGNYEWPKLTNVHHAAWPRRHYNSETERAYRNDPSLMLHYPIQFHNLVHELVLPPRKPPYEVMRQRVEELKYKQMLFECGRRAIRYARWADNINLLVNEEADEAWIENTRGYYGAMARYECSNMERFIERMPESTMGVLPSRDELEAKSGIVSITRHLGATAAVQAIDLRRAVQNASRADDSFKFAA